MIHVTAPALAIVLVVGYFGVNSIINGIGKLFGRKDQGQEKNNKE